MGWFDSLFAGDADDTAEQRKPRDPLGRLPPEPEFDAFRGAWMAGASLFDLFGDEPVEIQQAVGQDAPNRRPDVAKVETFLGRTGHLDLAKTEGPTGYWGSRVDYGIRGFQKDNALRIDGLINPNGPTLQRIGESLSGDLGEPSSLTRGSDVAPDSTTVPNSIRTGLDSLAPSRAPMIDRVSDWIGRRTSTKRFGTESASDDAGLKAPVSFVTAAGPDAQPSRQTRTLEVPRPGSVPAAPAQADQARSATAMIPDMPAYRREVLARQRGSWEGWNNELHQRGLSSAEQRSFQEIFAAEGGISQDPSGSASSGILQGTLDDLVERGYVVRIAKGTPPVKLSLPDRVAVYKGYFDDVLKTAGGSAALGKIGDDAAAAAFADTMFRHGRGDGTSAIQKAVNTVLPSDRAIRVDGRMGPGTLDSFARLAQDREARGRLLDALAEARRPLSSPGETARINHFRFHASPGPAYSGR